MSFNSDWDDEPGRKVRTGGRRRGLGRPIAAAVVGIGVIVGILALFQLSSTDPGYAGLVRNGGPFDAKTVRQVLPPASGITWTGWWSSVREYPTTERYTNVVSGEQGKQPNEGDTIDSDRYRTFTKDGVDVGVVGQFKFVLNTDDDPNAPEDHVKSPLRSFDTVYGQRTFAVPNDPEGRRLAPWDGDEGFATWLAVQVRPVYQEALREAIGEQNCRDIVANCAVLATTDASAAAAALTNAPDNSQAFSSLAGDIAAKTTTKINESLGAPYIKDIRFSLTAIELPKNLADAIGNVQKQNAATAEAAGRAQQANAEAQANSNRQAGYNNCPTCAELDRIRAQGDALSRLPQGVTVYAPGNDNLTLPAR
jgi:regulator of protease activity HflC (stomatin/prohibitin superfamily)